MSDFKNWWFSSDQRRGFCWESVKAFDYRSGSEGTVTSALYIYVDSGIFHLTGPEAGAVYKLLKERFPKHE